MDHRWSAESGRTGAIHGFDTGCVFEGSTTRLTDFGSKAVRMGLEQSIPRGRERINLSGIRSDAS
jgi:hypothetical protein